MMKRLLFLFAVVLVLTGCQKDREKDTTSLIPDDGLKRTFIAKSEDEFIKPIHLRRNVILYLRNSELQLLNYVLEEEKVIFDDVNDFVFFHDDTGEGAARKTVYYIGLEKKSGDIEVYQLQFRPSKIEGHEAYDFFFISIEGEETTTDVTLFESESIELLREGNYSTLDELIALSENFEVTQNIAINPGYLEVLKDDEGINHVFYVFENE